MTRTNASRQRTTTPRRDQAARTERQLLDAARHVFVDRGYRQATVAAITDRADTAHGTFYLYFKNKDDVFGRIMTEATDRLFQEAEVGWKPSPVDGVRAAINGYLVVFAQHVDLWRCLLEAAFVNPDIAARWAEIRTKFVDRIARSLRAKSLRARSARSIPICRRKRSAPWWSGSPTRHTCSDRATQQGWARHQRPNSSTRPLINSPTCGCTPYTAAVSTNKVVRALLTSAPDRSPSL